MNEKCHGSHRVKQNIFNGLLKALLISYVFVYSKLKNLSKRYLLNLYNLIINIPREIVFSRIDIALSSDVDFVFPQIHVSHILSLTKVQTLHFQVL